MTKKLNSVLQIHYAPFQIELFQPSKMFDILYSLQRLFFSSQTAVFVFLYVPYMFGRYICFPSIASYIHYLTLLNISFFCALCFYIFLVSYTPLPLKRQDKKKTKKNQKKKQNKTKQQKQTNTTKTKQNKLNKIKTTKKPTPKQWPTMVSCFHGMPDLLDLLPFRVQVLSLRHFGSFLDIPGIFNRFSDLWARSVSCTVLGDL